MKIQFLGACRNVTGSKHLLTTNAGTKVLIDCGLFQGRRQETRKRNREFPSQLSNLDAVVLGHAHIDHSGNLPNLVRHGYRGIIYATEPTDALCHYMLPDSGYLQERDVEFLNKKRRKQGLQSLEPLYTIADALDAVRLIHQYPLEKWMRIADDVEFKYVEAGHILGSALTIFRVAENGVKKKLAYIVDLGRDKLPLLRDPKRIKNADYVIMESTYGNRLHENIDEAKELLADTINRTVERGGKIIIPSFAMERTQELIYFIHELQMEGRIPTIPIFIDSPLAVNVTEVFRHFVNWFDDETKDKYRHNDDPFGLKQIEYVRSAERSRELNGMQTPAVIISASGMAEAGRILHHLVNNIENPRNTIIIVGFMAQNTLGRKLADGMNQVPILGERFRVRSEVVVSHAFSAHADRNELIEYAGGIRGVKKMFIVHGEENQSLELALAFKDLKNLKEVHVPNEGDEVEL